MRIELPAVPGDEVEAKLGSLRRAHLTSLSAPLDGMWEVFAKMGSHHEILGAGERAGYFSVDSAGRLLQFSLTTPFAAGARELFAAVLDRDDVKGAMVSTADPLFLGLCLDRHRRLRVHSYLYSDHRPKETEPDAELEAASFQVVAPGELETIAELQRGSFEHDPGEWLLGYLSNLIARRELFALRLDGEVLGTGEARVSDSQPPFADLGVITMPNHRGRGVATHVLQRLTKGCHERQLQPICSTTVENVAAQRAIAKAGFFSRHRLLEVAF